MKTYDYMKAVMNDMREWIADDDGYRLDMDEYKELSATHGFIDTANVLSDRLFDEMFGSDRVTGYSNGYSQDEEELSEFINGNEEMLSAAVASMGCPMPETLVEKDMTLRLSVFRDACDMIALEFLEHWEAERKGA